MEWQISIKKGELTTMYWVDIEPSKEELQKQYPDCQITIVCQGH